MQTSRLTGIAKAFVSCFGIGFSPILPGTLASLIGLFIFCFVSKGPIYLFAVGILLGLGLWGSRIALQSTEEKDPSWIVMDEVVGMMIALFGIPSRISLLVLGFILFRFFDSAKVFPIDRLEKAKGEWGIFLDDIGAGIYTNLILQLLLKLTA